MDNLRAERARNRLTQPQLAELVGVSVQTICDIENSKRIPLWSTMCKIADTLNVSLDELRGG